MIAQVARLGDSLVITNPGPIARSLPILDGGAVELSIANGQLIVSPIGVDASYELDELLDRITPENVHSEIDFGTTSGNEAL